MGGLILSCASLSAVNPEDGCTLLAAPIPDK
jgi:hypothetical protein